MAPRTKGTTTMADTPNTAAAPATATDAPVKKKRAPQGPRKPSPLYAFVRMSSDGSNRPELVKSFRDPRKMAEYIPTSTANGEHLLVIAPEA